MICIDSSSWIAYLSGQSGEDIELIDICLHDHSLQMAPAVLAELLSDPSLPSEAQSALLRIPMLELLAGFWERAGKLRAEMIGKKLKPTLADTLIAQVCMDHNLTLHARDAGFRSFSNHAGLCLILHGSVH